MSALNAGVLLDLRQVGVRHGDVVALHPLDLSLRRGEFVALVGANGSGKTTLLQALRGGVDHSGERRVALEAAREAMVFQRPFLLRLSVWRNMQVALWLARVPASERRARSSEALQRVGLAALGGRSARALSAGEQQRLALARAWSARPSLLLLDEPTASLDPDAKNDVEAVLAGFSGQGMTLVMSTHDLAQAERLASRVIFLERGQVRVDRPAALFFSERRRPAPL
ncbi:MAG: ATP-binding cassette domain-containing protein [Pseudomonadota bacterium]|nr:ATP-binding cassette domain-containing protein [Pseudomonadota bacterium]